MSDRNLYWANIPKVEDNLGFLIKNPEKMRVLKNVSVPFYVWTGSGQIEKLESIILDKETIDSFNSTGIHIYLYEPLGTRVAWFNNRSYEGEYPGYIPITEVSSNDLDSISKFIKNNNLKKVDVFTEDYNVQFLKSRYEEMNLHCLDIFLRGFNYKKKYDEVKNNIVKKFWCGNWRYVSHRHIMMSYLIHLDGNYSWNVCCDFTKLKENNWFDFDLLEKQDPQTYQILEKGANILETTSLSIDTTWPTVVIKEYGEYYYPGPMPNFSDKLVESYKECFCAVVNESRFAMPLGYLSEKVLTPCNARLPFILVAGPFSLEYLKKLGFRTFDQWWDESYDQEVDHHKRILKIFKIIDYINNKSFDELKIIYNEMVEILDHNSEVLKKLPYDLTVL